MDLETIIKDYLKRSHCCLNPKCKSDDITGDSVEVDGGGASQDVSCNVCDSSWTDVYRLVDVENINIEEVNNNGQTMVAGSEKTD